MSRPVVVQSCQFNRHATRVPRPSEGRGRGRLSENAGRAVADCAGICCCIPCTVMKILVLAVYKVPAKLCCKVLKRKQRRHVVSKKRVAPPCPRPGVGVVVVGSSGGEGNLAENSVADLMKNGDVIGGNDAADEDLEREMWDRFRDAGFWRSPSMRDT
ncbi:hypothetical protein SAY87_025522 [Trapa incisa]|uniref:Uncharacterized protein n=1 Tax=Trapa incisa TaxID=236973 RepID=A0AAN7GHT9_9MYRT|nr:hypothetical protein SAY87_025522 [Trapa incisa]